MRGVSEVIAIILILMITISLAGLAYMFISTTLSDTTAVASSTVSSTSSAMMTFFVIESVSSDTVYIRNTGSNTLVGLAAYIDDMPANATYPISIEPGTVGNITLREAFRFSLGSHNLKVTCGSASAQKPIRVVETLQKVSLGSSYNASLAEQYCSSNCGMQLYVPHTQDSLVTAWALANSGSDPSSGYLYILGIYPKVQGARCVNVAMNSQSCTNWTASDGGSFWVGNITTLSEPNGDNCLTGSMGYTWNSNGMISSYNDLSCPGYSSSRFICQKITIERE